MPRIMVSLLPGGLLVVQNQMHLYPSGHPSLRPPIPPQPTFNPSVCPVTTVERMAVEPNPKNPTLKIPPSKAWCRLHLYPPARPLARPPARSPALPLVLSPARWFRQFICRYNN